MFNKLYKSANEKFSSDAARDRFLASLDQRAVRKKKNIRPVITSAAALAACFAVTVFGINLYNSRPIANERAVPLITASPNTTADAPAAITESPDAPTYIAEDTDTTVQNKESSRTAKTERTPAAVKERSKVPQAKETPQSAETVSAVDNSAVKSAAEPTEIPHAPVTAAEASAPSVTTESEVSKKAAAPEIYSMSVLNEAAPENAAVEDAAADYGVADIAAADESVPNTDCFFAKSAVAATRTLEDYNNFIGRDIRDGICIPDGMTDLTPLTRTDGDGWVFVYDGNGKHVQIRTMPSVQAETKSAGGANSTARASSGTLRFSAGGIDFEITAEGLSGEELDALAASLKK